MKRDEETCNESTILPRQDIYIYYKIHDKAILQQRKMKK